MAELTATAVAVMVTSLVGFLSLVVVLVFLWKVYERGRPPRPGRRPRRA